MDNKGQMGMGWIMIGFVAVLVGLVLFQAIAAQVATTSQTVSAVNVTYTVPAVGAYIDLVGQELLNTPVVWNTTGGTVESSNYTIAEGVSSTTGVKTIRYRNNGGNLTAGGGVGSSVNVTYNYGPNGYVDDSGARGIIGIILILTAVGIALLLLPGVYDNIKDLMG